MVPSSNLIASPTTVFVVRKESIPLNKDSTVSLKLLSAIMTLLLLLVFHSFIKIHYFLIPVQTHSHLQQIKHLYISLYLSSSHEHLSLKIRNDMYFFTIHNREERQCSEQKSGMARILQSTYQITPDPAGCQLMKKSLTFSPYNADNPFVFIRDKVYYTRYPRK